MRPRSSAKWVALAALLLGHTLASATPITYGFTGVVYAVTGDLARANSPVTGTFTFDFDAGSITTPGRPPGSASPSGWEVDSGGGSVFNEPVPTASLFSMTLVVGGASYNTPAISPFANSTKIIGAPSSLYYMSETYSDADEGVFSQLELLNASIDGHLGPPAYLSNGHPNPDAIDFATSWAQYALLDSIGETSTIDYYFTSMYALPSTDPAPVPLPAAGWLLISGLGGLRLFRTRALSSPGTAILQPRPSVHFR